MLTPEGVPVSFDPVPYDPEAVLAMVSTATLIELEGVLHDPERSRADNPWLQAVALERSTRVRTTRTLKTLEKYQPSEVESPIYDAEAGPAAYLELVRDANCEAGMALELYDEGMAEKYSINRLIRSYVESKLEENANSLPINSVDSEFVDFLTANARGILLGPLSAVTLSYRREKSTFIHNRVTELKPGSGVLRYKLHSLSKEQLVGLRIELESLPYSLPVPDFYQMQRIHQNDILEMIFSECTEMHEFMNEIDPKLIWANPKRMPLAYHSVAELRQAVTENPSLSSAEVCNLFLEQPQDFWKALTYASKTETAQRLEAEAASRRQKLEESAAQAQQSELGEESVEELENIDFIERLLNDPEVREEVLDVEPGGAVMITEPDRIISASKFDSLLAKHIELIGRALWENTERPNPNGLRLVRWDESDIGRVLRGGYEGNLRNVSITQLGVTEEELGQALNNYIPEKIPAKSALRLLIEAEMKPTGKPAEPVHLTMLLLTRKSDQWDGLHKSMRGARATGPATALRLRMQAQQTARFVKGNALIHPLRVGLPGLGKRR